MCPGVCAHTQRTPLISMVHSNQVINFIVTFVLQERGELAVEMMAFLCIFGKLKV